jgi:hypothetical protein
MLHQCAVKNAKKGIQQVNVVAIPVFYACASAQNCNFYYLQKMLLLLLLML